MSDLVERLLERTPLQGYLDSEGRSHTTHVRDPSPLEKEAAAKITALRARVAELERLLQEITDAQVAETLALSDDKIVAASVLAHGSAEASVAAVHKLALMTKDTIIEHYKKEQASAVKAALERAAECADQWAHRHLYDEPNESLVHRSEQIAAAGFIAAAIRNLIPTPPAQEE